MAFYDQARAFVRSEGEEEITPPCKQRSHESLSVAHILQAELDPAARVSSPLVPDDGRTSPTRSETSRREPPSPGSPSVEAAAAVLGSVQQSAHNKAVDCLMSLASFGAKQLPPPARPPKRPRYESLSNDNMAARRRLAMRADNRNRIHASAYHYATNTAPCITIAGVQRQVRMQSDATLLQLKLLAAAFKLCPSPTSEQMEAIANRVAVTTEKLETWFQSRRTLDAWISSQPHLQPADVAGMFFDNREVA